jgi:hypothetical protein
LFLGGNARRRARAAIEEERMATTSRIARAAPAAAALAALAACAAPPPPMGGPSQIRFEVTDLSDPAHPRAVPAQSGATLDFPLTFAITVRTVGTDPAGVQHLIVDTTSVTPACGEMPIRRAYRTKRIVLPEAVTAEPATPQEQSFNLPLSTLTLYNIALCDIPAPTRFLLDARVLNGAGAVSRAALTINVGGAPAPAPAAAATPPEARG